MSPDGLRARRCTDFKQRNSAHARYQSYRRGRCRAGDDYYACSLDYFRYTLDDVARPEIYSPTRPSRRRR
jgi:hypothetical protein